MRQRCYRSLLVVSCQYLGPWSIDELGPWYRAEKSHEVPMTTTMQLGPLKAGESVLDNMRPRIAAGDDMKNYWSDWIDPRLTPSQSMLFTNNKFTLDSSCNFYFTASIFVVFCAGFNFYSYFNFLFPIQFSVFFRACPDFSYCCIHSMVPCWDSHLTFSSKGILPCFLFSLLSDSYSYIPVLFSFEHV